MSLARPTRESRFAAVLTLLLSLWGTAQARADITIVGGHLDLASPSGRLVLQGDSRGFTFTGNPGTGIFTPIDQCNHFGGPCAAGDRVGLHALWTNGDLPGTATLDGVTYSPVGGFAHQSMSVEFSGSFVLPPFSEAAVVRAPFVFTGRFAGELAGGAGGVNLVGSGVVTISLTPFTVLPGTQRWHVAHIRYEFGAVAPAPWTSADIGAVGTTGATSVSANTFVVAGDGADIWGTADSFRFTHRVLSGPGSITAHVIAAYKTSGPALAGDVPHPFAKAGVMLRASPGASSAHVVLDVKPDGDLEFMVRYADGESTSYIAGAPANAQDVWLQLARDAANAITGAYSLDGVNWRTLATVSALFGSQDLLAGLAVTSHERDVLHGALFDQVAVDGPRLTQNLLIHGDFEAYQPPALGLPGWVSDDALRQTAAKSETHQPRSGTKNGACWTPDYLDCGIYQDVVAPVSGTYVLRIHATADRAGGLVGANVNGATAASSAVAAAPFGRYSLYSMTLSASAGDVIRVWMYSPALPGYVVIDDVSLVSTNATTD